MHTLRPTALLLAAIPLALLTGTLVFGSVAPSDAARADEVHAPDAPTISGGALIVTTDDTPTISGLSLPYSIITGSVGAETCKAKANFHGKWSCTVTLAADGDYPISLIQTWSIGGPSPAATSVLRLERPPPPDLTAPDPPVFLSPVSTASGTHSAKTTDGAPVMSGTAEPGSHVRVTLGGDTYCETTADAGGAWSCSGATLPLGSHAFSGFATDQAGNTSAASSTSAFELTVVAPAPPKTQPQPVPRTVPETRAAAVPFELHIASESGDDLDGSSLTQGDRIVLWGTGLPAGSPVRAELHSRVVALGGSEVGGAGEFRVLVTIPSTIEPGTHEFVVTVAPPGHEESTAVRTAVIAAAAVPPAPADRPARSHQIAQREVEAEAASDTTPTTEGDSFRDPTIFGNSLTPVTELGIDAEHLLVAGGISALFLLLVAFPAELLESTLRENYHRAFRWFDPVARRVAVASARYRRRFSNPWIASTLLIGVGAVIFGFADPEFGFTEKSLRLVLGMAISLTVLNLVISAIVIGYGRRRWGVQNTIIPLPAALLIVAASVVLSRLTGIMPAFLFGLVVGILWTHRQTIRQEGRLVLILMVLTIAVGVGSYLAYSAIAGTHDEGFAAELGKEVTASLAIESLSTLLVALMPFAFLDGQKIFQWSRVAWILTYFIAVVTFVLIVTPVAEESGLLHAVGWGWIVAFAIFGVLAVGTWALFRIFPDKAGAGHHDDDAEGDAVEVGATPSNPEAGAEQPSPPPR